VDAFVIWTPVRSSDTAAVARKVASELEGEDRLHQYWDEGEIVEILGVVALFGFLNRWNDSAGTPLEEGAGDFADEYLKPHGWERGKHTD